MRLRLIVLEVCKMSMHGEVKVWHMSEEERLDYIKKHPIKKTDSSGSSFANIGKDYKWRGLKAAKARKREMNE